MASWNIGFMEFVARRNIENIYRKIETFLRDLSEFNVKCEPNDISL